jgi:hypothetical protein
VSHFNFCLERGVFLTDKNSLAFCRMSLRSICKKSKIWSQIFFWKISNLKNLWFGKWAAFAAWLSARGRFFFEGKISVHANYRYCFDIINEFCKH